MSRYLCNEISSRENIEVRVGTEVVDVSGDDRLETLMLRDAEGDTSVRADALFVLIGAHPHTDWLPATVARDEHGYVLTGDAAGGDGERTPQMFETSVPGVFAVGDVRSRSVKRVAAAVGEGSAVIQHVHSYLESVPSGQPAGDTR